MDRLNLRNGFKIERDEIRYARIWKSMEHCVNVCILSTFRSAREMLCGWNWSVVHERCVHIIQKHMKELNIKDPHEFDKAVCWYAVSTGKDRDPLWRCICSFFFAAGMQLDKQQRMDAEEFAKVEASKSEKSDKSDKSYQSRDDMLTEILKELRNSHKKLDDVKSKLIQDNSVNMSNRHQDNSVNMSNRHVSQTQVSQVNNGTVNHHIYHAHPNTHPNTHPTQSLDEFLKKILGEIKDVPPKSGTPFSGSNGYYPPGPDAEKASPVHYDRVIYGV